MFLNRENCIEQYCQHAMNFKSVISMKFDRNCGTERCIDKGTLITRT